MNRRVFVGGIFAGLGAAHAVPPKVRTGDIPKRLFGKTGEKLTIVGQAGGRFPLLGGKEEARAIVRRAYDLGINYFDCAHVYWDGKSEEVYGDVLPEFRKNIFLTTKAMGRTRQSAEDQLNLSLKRLKTDYVDLWQMHAIDEMSDVDQIFGPGGAVEAFEAAKKAGKCRFIGFTGHRDPHVHLEMLKRYDKYDTILMPLNAADPGYLSFEKLALPVAVERGLGIQGMKSTANAKLLSAMNIKDCLSYALSLPIHCLAVGCTTIGQIEDDVRIAQSFQPLNEQEVKRLRERAGRLKGPETEDWKRKVGSTASTDSPRHLDV